MNIKQKIIQNLQKETLNKEKTPPTIDSKHPLDMRAFWRNINDFYFSKNAKSNWTEVNSLVKNFSKHKEKDDEIYLKTGFPKNFQTFAGKTHDPALKKNNPNLLTKFLGVYIYWDSSDWILEGNANNSEWVKDETNFLLNKIDEVEFSNMNNLDKVKKIFSSEQRSVYKKTRSSKSNIHWSSGKVMRERFDNWINQIFLLQHIQLAESVSCIKIDSKNNSYHISFEPSEKIPNIIMNKKQYNDFIWYRDPHNSVCIYDLFQEKTHRYFNTISKTRSKSKSMKVGMRKEDIQVAKQVQIHYDYCHHCKQRKPGEVMMQCQGHLFGSKKCERPIKTYYINGTAVIRKNMSLIVRNYEGEPQEFIDASGKYEGVHQCKRFYCHFCLKGSYDTIIEDLVGKTDWLCPYCTGQCFCSRCLRKDKLLKLIGWYVSLGGKIEDCYSQLLDRSFVLNQLRAYMIISNLMIVMNDPLLKPLEMIKKCWTDDWWENKHIVKLIEHCKKYKKHWGKLKDYYNCLFSKEKVDKLLWVYKKTIGKNINEFDEKITLLNKKKQRSLTDKLEGLKYEDFSNEEEEKNCSESGEHNSNKKVLSRSRRYAKRNSTRNKRKCRTRKCNEIKKKNRYQRN